MYDYVILIRGINVGGKNKIPMAALRKCLEGLGYTRVTTYIASGNVLVRSKNTAAEVKKQIEQALQVYFALDSAVKVLVLDQKKLEAIVHDKPTGFGDQPEVYYSDVIFLIDISTRDALQVFDPKEGVDTIWPGKGVVYSQRLGAKRAKSRLSTIVGKPAYKSMTIRTWSTVTSLLRMLQADQDNTVKP